MGAFKHKKMSSKSEITRYNLIICLKKIKNMSQSLQFVLEDMHYETQM